MPVFSDAITPDPEMAALVEKIRAPFAKDLARAVGTTDSLLYRRGNFNGTFDDLICEAMLTERDAEIALSPGFRWGGTLLPGDAITFEALTNATAMTYPNCYRIEMTGEQLKDVLEDVADNIFHPDPYFQGGGDMVRIGGMGYAIDVGKPMGQRISEHDASEDRQADRGREEVRRRRLGQRQRGRRRPADLGRVSKHVAHAETGQIEPNSAVKVAGA